MPAKIKVKPGTKFGWLTVLCEASQRNGIRMFMCFCECGTTGEYSLQLLRSGHTKSCGCLQRKKVSELNAIHGMSNSTLHKRWRSMIARCTNPNNPAYDNYGGRGITVSEEFMSFAVFHAYMVSIGWDDDADNSDVEIDRPRNGEGYKRGNLRLVTLAVNQRNKRDNLLLSHRGVTLTAIEWSERTGISYRALLQRKRRGWSDERALTQPPRVNYRSTKPSKLNTVKPTNIAGSLPDMEF